MVIIIKFGGKICRKNEIHRPFHCRRPGWACWVGSRQSRWTEPPQQVSSRSVWLQKDTQMSEPCRNPHRSTQLQTTATIPTKGTVVGKQSCLLCVVSNSFILDHTGYSFAGSSTDFSLKKKRKKKERRMMKSPQVKERISITKTRRWQLTCSTRR